MKKLIVLITVTLLAVPGQAKTLYISAKALLDVNTGALVSEPVIRIDDGLITEITHLADADIPAKAEHIKLPGKTLLPGLMDMHVHLTSSPEDMGYARLGLSIPSQTIKGVVNAEQTLLAGFTTVRNVGASGFADIAIRDAIARGDIPGPRMLASGPSLGITGGHCDNNLLPSEYQVKSAGVADGPWHAVTKVRENIKYGADTIKVCATGGVFSKGTKVGAQQYTEEEMRAVAEEAHRRGLIVAAHAHGTEGIKAAIKAGIDSIEHASFLDDEAIALAKAHGTYLSMDVYVTDYILAESAKHGALPESIEKEKQTGKRQRASFKKAVDAGVNIVFATDAAIYPHGKNARQFYIMTEHGMTPLQAIQAATVQSAKLIQKEQHLGQISKGFAADIIAVEGNPLNNIRLLESVNFVMKDGKVYKNQ